jgi:Na+-driven multidrug efflux pump
MKDLTTGSVPRHLVHMSAFLAMSMAVQTLYLLADLYWVGHLGKEAIGSEYLRVVSVNFVSAGVVFVTSSVFQGIGYTLPPLFSSMTRLVLFALPAIYISRSPGFEIRHVWYLSVGSIILQMCVNLLLLRHELRKRLRFDEPDTFIPASATAS